MKLSTKMLGIPIGLMVVVFLMMGIFIARLLVSNSETTRENEMTNLIHGIEKQLHTGLAIVTASSLPANVFLALEGNDDGLAKDLMKQVKSMGLDVAYVTDLNGKVLYPKEKPLPNGLNFILEKAKRVTGATEVFVLDKKMVGYAPIMDVETPKGFLIFVSNLPDEFTQIAEKAVGTAGRSSDTNGEKENKTAFYLEKAHKESESQGKAFLRKMLLTQITIMLVGLISMGFVFSLLTRSISKPLNRIIESMKDGADRVASASSQVSSASQSLAEGASEQAAGIEETSSSIEEMSSMTKRNADNANQADTLMADTSKVVEEANRSMIGLTQSMKEISAASEETAKIIKTIDEIAFQTNLLALNAAVEAARAGEAGAGFAVVADEVRNLAMRAADAAKNTANLIEGSVKKIKNGSDIVAKTNEAFTKVATGAKKVGELVGEISVASQEQAQGIDQINKAVAEMDKVVQQNAGSAEESASASEEMNAQAAQMKGFVSELVALVGGANGNVIKNSEFHVGAIHELPLRSSGTKKMSGLSVSKGKQPASIKKSGEMKAPVSKKKGVKPEEIIPLDEGDFKEF